MSDSTNKTPLEDLLESLKEYLDMRMDETKLKLSAELTRVSSRIVCFFCISLLTILVIALLSIALYTWIGNMLNNPLYGMLITIGILILSIIILYSCRNSLFGNSILRMYIKMFFNNSNDEN